MRSFPETDIDPHFPGLESPGKKPLVLESSGNLLNSARNMKCLEGSKEN